jgi:hypothetical protein
MVDFRVWATEEQLQALGQYMKSNGIRYGKVPKGVEIYRGKEGDINGGK